MKLKSCRADQNSQAEKPLATEDQTSYGAVSSASFQATHCANVPASRCLSTVPSITFLLQRKNRVIQKRSHFDLELFVLGDTHLIKLPQFFSSYKRTAYPVSVLMIFFLGLYLMLAAFLITRFQVDYVTSPATPPACDPPDALVRMAPRSNVKDPLSLCT